MSKIDSLITVASGYLSTQQINANFGTISTAFSNTLSLDGSSPNTMQADLDMNGHALLNAIISQDDYSLFSGVLGSMASQNSSLVTITGGTISGVTLSTITFSGTQTFASIKLTGSILDTNSNELFKFTTTASAVNEFTITNAATANSPILSVTGGDTNIDINFLVKGTGIYNFKSTVSNGSTLKLFEATGSGSNYISLKSPDTLAGNITFVLPTADVVNGYLKSDGSGNLSLTTLSSPLFSLSYVSAAQVVTYGGGLTLAHSLGVAPKLVVATWICQTGELGYTAGDRLEAPLMYDNGTNMCGIMVVSDSTNLNVRYASTMVFGNKGTGARAAATAGNWKVEFRAYA